MHYDSEKPLFMSCDASQCGAGVVLSHNNTDACYRPVAFASYTFFKESVELQSD